MNEITIATVSSCGHSAEVEVLPGREVAVRASIASRPCFGCQQAAEAQRQWQAGDIAGAQSTLIDWMNFTFASRDHRGDRLMAFIGALV